MAHLLIAEERVRHPDLLRIGEREIFQLACKAIFRMEAIAAVYRIWPKWQRPPRPATQPTAAAKRAQTRIYGLAAAAAVAAQCIVQGKCRGYLYTPELLRLSGHAIFRNK